MKDRDTDKSWVWLAVIIGAMLISAAYVTWVEPANAMSITRGPADAK